MPEITLTQGYTALIDNEDASILENYSWHLHRSNSCVYARTFAKGHEFASPSGALLMHRLLMRPQKHEFVDHINRNSLDNRRENLRIVNRSQSNRNRSNARTQTSVYQINGKYTVVLNCGRFDNEEDAVMRAQQVRAFLDNLRKPS